MSSAGGIRWGFVFLSAPLQLEEEQRLDLVRLAAAAWFQDQQEVHFDWGELRGTLRPTSDTMLIGSFCGQRFTAEIFMLEKSAKVEFLVAEAQLRAARAEIAEA